MIIPTQGEVSTAGGLLYGTPSGYQSYITGLNFVNLNSYVLEVYLYRQIPNSKKLLYKFSLDAEDVVEDDTPYILNHGDYIWAKSSVAGTQFVVMGSESRIN